MSHEVELEKIKLYKMYFFAMTFDMNKMVDVSVF